MLDIIKMVLFLHISYEKPGTLGTKMEPIALGIQVEDTIQAAEMEHKVQGTPTEGVALVT